jgi:hypothetical protein
MADQSRYTELATALRHRLAVIADNELYEQNPAGHIEELKRASEKITALQRELPSPVEPELAHFLARCSYAKALAFLEQKFAGD